ncbi:type II toxin-antitoxin system MqsA family antitoxin [uncultured Thiodictyon sp.]|uniref:type II toxin-antitoxin system MqsA family antitoxin n=1 Tax=uncultured Thiodictyon sp. TaxID=1846217 RepID=UPI0025FF5CDE|nr:type II toxin-antitoxin system MqsA family antitoxin [uncultured Thiodictyon sp.]
MTIDQPNCPLCGGSRTQGRTTFTAELGFGVVVVRHVPATVCDQCGEEWLDDSVAEALESVIAAARAKHANVEVTEWRGRAA